MRTATHSPLTFFKRFLASPRAVGAILPTSLHTARVMAKPIDPNGTVCELGAGTGSITAGILERLNDASKLTSVEIDPFLAAVFKQNFPHISLVVGDAEQALAASNGFDAIISGVPFTVMNHKKRERMFSHIKEKLHNDGVFVAIQYSLSSLKELRTHFQTVRVKVSFVNVPPAFIYVCRNPKITKEKRPSVEGRNV